MMRMIAMVAAAAVGTAAKAEPPAFDRDAVKAHCAAEWSDNFAMQKFCLDRNVEGHAEFVRLAADLPPDVSPAAIDGCLEEWTPVWAITAFCAQRQVEGARELAGTIGDLPAEIGAQVETKCRADWPDNFAMQAFCADQQAEAWRALQN